jgi:two-component system, NtrC family, response regulator
MSGLVVLERILRLSPAVQAVMMTGEGDIRTAVQAMKLGARDFLAKPFQANTLNSTIQSLLHPRSSTFTRLAVGDSPQIREVWSQISRYALPDVSILLVGESGTGKELFAHAIHAQSKRSAKPLVALDCATLPETLVESELFGHEKGAFTGAIEQKIGKFELAQGSTLFLDEVGNLPVSFQAKLLRVLQERYVDRLGGNKSVPVDVRIVSATNLDLEQAIQKGAFREDLYYRLAEVMIRIPPLRERKGDIERLATHFIEQSNHRFGRRIRGISDSAWDLLREYRWPGNVRELENTIRASVLAAEDIIEPIYLPEYLSRPNSKPEASAADAYFREIVCRAIDSVIENGALDLKALVAGFGDQIERAVFAELLGRRRRTQSELCALLKIDPKTLRAKLKKYDLHNS